MIKSCYIIIKILITFCNY